MKILKENKLIIISILITICIEIFVCNFGFFRTILLGNKPKEVEYSFNENSIDIKIDERVSSINFYYKNELKDKISYYLTYVGKTDIHEIEINPKVMLVDDNHYINFDTHVPAKKIHVELFTQNDIEIDKIVINKPNMYISFLRMTAIWFMVLFVSRIRNAEEEYNKNSKKQNGIFLINLMTICAFIIIYMISNIETTEYFIKPENIDIQDTIQMQTEAIANGQIELLEEPSEELKSMKNPYDYKARERDSVPYLYDTAYYNGHYYNYFGIAPIITSILPFRLITGGYIITYIFNLFYMVIAIFSLYFLYKKLINRYIQKISLANYYLGFYAILFGSNLLTLCRGQKYDIVVMSGIAFLLISLNLAYSILENNKYIILKLILLGITTGLIVLSKPNLIVYYLLILYIMLIYIKNIDKKAKIRTCIVALIPLMLLAVFQMYLNYIRFDNILEFGAKYQLTGLNMLSCMNYTVGRSLAGLLEYIFRTISINPLKFPFVFINTQTALTAINEVCYEARLVGLISIPIMWAYLMIRNILKDEENKEFRFLIYVMIVVSLIAMILSTCAGGICELYSIDFKLILSIGAVLLLLKLLEKHPKNIEIRKIFVIICVATIIIMVPLGLTTENNFLENNAINQTVYLKNIFEFWT